MDAAGFQFLELIRLCAVYPSNRYTCAHRWRHHQPLARHQPLLLPQRPGHWSAMSHNNTTAVGQCPEVVPDVRTGCQAGPRREERMGRGRRGSGIRASSRRRWFFRRYGVIRDGAGAHLPATADERPPSTASGPPLAAARAGDRQAEPGLVRRCHIHRDAARLPVSRGDHRRGDAQGAGLAAVQHDATILGTPAPASQPWRRR